MTHASRCSKGSSRTFTARRSSGRGGPGRRSPVRPSNDRRRSRTTLRRVRRRSRPVELVGVHSAVQSPYCVSMEHKFADWEGIPARWLPGEAWAFVKGEWIEVHSSDVGIVPGDLGLSLEFEKDGSNAMKTIKIIAAAASPCCETRSSRPGPGAPRRHQKRDELPLLASGHTNGVIDGTKRHLV